MLPQLNRMIQDQGQPSNKELQAARSWFGDLLGQKADEREFQKLFAECPFILSRALPLRLHPQDIEPRGRPGISEPDFIIHPGTRASAETFGVVEIKRPDSKILVEGRKRIIRLSADAQTAVRQADEYALALKDSLIRHSRSLILGNDIHKFVIMGESETTLARFSLELVSEQSSRLLPGGLRIIPYDDLFREYERELPRRIYYLQRPVAGGLEGFDVAILCPSQLHGFVAGVSNELESRSARAVVAVLPNGVAYAQYINATLVVGIRAQRLIPFVDQKLLSVLLTGRRGSTSIHREVVDGYACFDGHSLAYCRRLHSRVLDARGLEVWDVVDWMAGA